MSVISIEATQSPAAPRHVRHALGYMRTNFHEKITLEDVATACGISQRALLRQFRQFVGVSPIAHLLRLRLAEARSALQQRDQSAAISDIALRCGIPHVGRFATEYRKAFGELPSATLRRTRGRPANGGTAVGEDAGDGCPAPFVSRRRPSLLILPLRTETLSERRIAQELMEQVAATLSRASVASVAFADPAVVVSRQAAWLPKGSAVTQYCLLGRLVQRDDRVGVTLWLTDAEGRHVWGGSYDGAAEDLSDLLRRVVDGVVSGVVSGITAAEIERIRRKDPQTLAARELLMHAMPILLKADAGSWRKMSAIASRAMELDPDDALPVALEAYCQARLYETAVTASFAGMRGTALQLLSRAVALDSSDPFVTATRAGTATLLRLHPDAEHLAARALAMDPTSAWPHERAGVCFLYQKKPAAAIAYFSRAMQLHGPLMPRENCLFGIAKAHQCAGRPEAALRWIRRAFAENPRAEVTHRFLIWYEEMLGHHTEAQSQAAALCRAYPETRLSRILTVYPCANVEYLLRAGVPF